MQNKKVQCYWLDCWIKVMCANLFDKLVTHSFYWHNPKNWTSNRSIWCGTKCWHRKLFVFVRYCVYFPRQFFRHSVENGCMCANLIVQVGYHQFVGLRSEHQQTYTLSASGYGLNIIWNELVKVCCLSNLLH